ncbi:hypothetical protein [Corynebacterium meitnerae]|uniref:Uncharacterized protein n=1 Tax=Corynebacterium meitnerae TaxID=2913498 RepID=A0A9X3RL21_9CORY|nr:hypothetical protein [Corynebacterium meitnerae]MCZ9294637.1 hypothetical protein [Corynebacterium meitnerae]
MRTAEKSGQHADQPDVRTRCSSEVKEISERYRDAEAVTPVHIAEKHAIGFPLKRY